jgi:hypothetical protein
MKQSLLFLLVSVSLLAPRLPGATAPFEGIVNLQVVSGKNQPLALDYMIKGPMVRVAFAGAKTNTIMNVQTREKIVLLPAEKKYFKQSDPVTGLSLGLITELEDTGRTGAILSYPCRVYLLKEKGQTTELWVTDGLGYFIGAGVGTMVIADRWVSALYCRNGYFPLRVVIRDEKGNEGFRMEAIGIKPAKLPASVFLPTAKYQETHLAKPEPKKSPRPGTSKSPQKP